MAFDAGLVEWANETLAPLGTITMRKMMGVATLYCDGAIFAVVDDELWFKCDAVSDPVWDEAGCERFQLFERNGKPATMNYRRAPGDCYDDADAMRLWAMLAIEAGVRAAARKRGKNRKRGG